MKAAEKAVRRALTRLLAGRPLPEQEVRAAGLRRIALLRLDRRLGNQVILFPVVDALRAACPQAEVDVVAPGPYHVAFEGRPSVSRVVRFERSRPLGPNGLVRLVQLRARRYDLVVEAGHHHSFSLSGALVARQLGAPLRMGFRRGESPAFLNVLVDPPSGEGVGRARIYFELARKLDPGATYEPPRWHVTPEERRRAVERRAHMGLRPLTAGIHPGARGAKRWPPERFVEVARELERRGYQPVIFLGPAESDQDEVWRKARGPEWKLVAQPPLRAFAALVSTLSLWISGDTGPLHVATSCGVPAVGLIQHREGLESFEPGPLFRRVYAEGRQIEVAEVLEALDRPPGAPAR